MKLDKAKLSSIIKTSLEEDIGKGDITTGALIPKNLKTKAIIIAKEKGVIAGLPVAKLVFNYTDGEIKFRPLIKEGTTVKKNTVIAELSGNARGILMAERTALNFLGRLSGIATLTQGFAKRASAYKVKIMDTRKTTPGLRILEKYAVKVGGGYNHRMGLWDQVLIKDNHLKILMPGRKSICDIIRQVSRNTLKGIKVEIEVKNLKEFAEALQAKPDIIMLDNMNVDNVKKAVKMRNFRGKRPLLEVSGGITLNNIRKYAESGVEIISVGSLTHSAQSLDLSLKVT